MADLEGGPDRDQSAGDEAAAMPRRIASPADRRAFLESLILASDTAEVHLMVRDESTGEFALSARVFWGVGQRELRVVLSTRNPIPLEHSITLNSDGEFQSVHVSGTSYTCPSAGMARQRWALDPDTQLDRMLNALSYRGEVQPHDTEVPGKEEINPRWRNNQAVAAGEGALLRIAIYQDVIVVIRDPELKVARAFGTNEEHLLEGMESLIAPWRNGDRSRLSAHIISAISPAEVDDADSEDIQTCKRHREEVDEFLKRWDFAPGQINVHLFPCNGSDAIFDPETGSIRLDE